MDTLSLLGVSKSAVAIVFDLAYEIYGIEKFVFYANIDLDVKPNLPLKKYTYEIKPLESLPIHKDQFVLATPGPRNKALVYKDFFIKKNIDKARYQNIVHPSSYIAISSKLETGVLIEPMCAISSQTKIGFGVFIKRGTCIGHHNIIGAFSDINPGVITSGNVKIGSGCIIGTGALIRDGVSIGDNTVIGMGSVVTKDVPANCMAYGNPCKVVEIDKEIENNKLYEEIKNDWK